MSTDHTEQVPEVSGDETRLVPPQGQPKAEWPKKIRTLTASELDRLTIDSEGRFMWDGKVVNYGRAPVPQSSETRLTEAAPSAAPATSKPVDPFDVIAAEILESAKLEVSENRAAAAPVRAAEPAPPAPPAPPMMPAETVQLADEIKRVEAAQWVETPVIETRLVDTQMVESRMVANHVTDSVDQFTPVVPAVASPRPTEMLRPVAIQPAPPEKVRVALSFFQSLSLLLVILAMLLGAAGVAALGLVAASDWSCRVGITKQYCPPPPPAPPAPPARPDIPA